MSGIERFSNGIASAWQSRLAIRYARKRGGPGIQFAEYGRSLGRRIFCKTPTIGIDLNVCPVNITRYFEFEFALHCLPLYAENCLDVSSPRLFSLFVAERHLAKHITMINPDESDLRYTDAVLAAANIRNITVKREGVGALSNQNDSYNCIWCISVVEHIRDSDDDVSAMHLMYEALAPGGILIVTVPTDKMFWEEYRPTDHYGTQIERELGSNMYFFQRYYDLAAIHTRLLADLSSAAVELTWFGETSAGWWDLYEARWRHQGRRVTAGDARYIVDHFDRFGRWEDMPGKGVCGIRIHKPVSA